MPRGRKLDQAKFEGVVVERYCAGFSLREVAKAHYLSIEGVRGILRRNHIQLRAPFYGMGKAPAERVKLANQPK